MAKDAKIMLHGHTWPHFFIQTSPAAALRHLAMPPKTSHATLQCAHKWIPYNRAMINASPVWQWADRFACLKCNYFLVRCKYVDDTETKCGEDLIWKSMNPSNFGDHLHFKHQVPKELLSNSSSAAQRKTPSSPTPASPPFLHKRAKSDQPVLPFSPVSKPGATKDDSKMIQLRYAICCGIPFSSFDNKFFRDFASQGIGVPHIGATALKTFMDATARQLRQNFASSLLPNAPGVSVTVDEWSDIQLIPWMGMTITTVDLNFDLRLHSPGMRCIDDVASAENIIRWLLEQLARMGIEPEDVASICCDNAANMSKAVCLNPHLRRVLNFCMCHLINIAVKRATTQPIDMMGSAACNEIPAGVEDSSSAGTAPQVEPAEHRPESQRFWYEEAIEEPDESTAPSATERAPEQRKRVRKPTEKMREFMETHATSGSCYDVDSEPIDVAFDADLSVIHEVLHDAPTAGKNAASITMLFLRCQQIVTTISKSHTLSKRFEAFQNLEFQEEMRDYQEQLKIHQTNQLEFQQQWYSYKDALQQHQADPMLPKPVEPDVVKSIEPELPQVGRKLVSDVSTRWNSTLALICSLIENSRALDELADLNPQVPKLSEQDWGSLEELAQFLIQFERISNRVQGEHVLASEALLVVKKFRDLIVPNAKQDGPTVKIMKQTIRQHLQNHRAKLSRILSHCNYDSMAVFCAFVDPRVANKHFLPSDADYLKAQATFYQKAVCVVQQWNTRVARYKSKQQKPPPQQERDHQPVQQQQPQPQGDDKDADSASNSDFGFDDFSSRSSQEADMESAQILAEKQLEENIRNEHVNFLTECKTFEVDKHLCTAEATKAVLAWWRHKAAGFPTLRIVAAHAFSARITSASAERLFSVAGLMKTASTNSLSANTFDNMVAVLYNDPVMQEMRLLKADTQLARKRKTYQSMHQQRK